MPHSRSHKTHRRNRSKSHKTHRRHRRSTSRKMRRCPRGSRKTCRKISRKTRSSHRKRGGSALGEWWKKKRQSWEEARKIKKQTMGDETLGKALKADIKGVPGEVATAIGDAAATFGKNVAQKATDTAKAIQELPCKARVAQFKNLIDCLKADRDQEALRDLKSLLQDVSKMVFEEPTSEQKQKYGLSGGKRRSRRSSKKLRKSRKTHKSRKSRRCPRGSIRHSRKRSRRSRKSKKHSRKHSRKSKKHSRKSKKHSRRH